MLIRDESQWGGTVPLKQTCKYCTQKLSFPFLSIQTTPGHAPLLYHAYCASRLITEIGGDLEQLLRPQTELEEMTAAFRRARNKGVQKNEGQDVQEEAEEDAATRLRAYIAATIEQQGFFIMHVAAGEGDPPYTYTVGLAPEMPELIVIGISYGETPTILHRVVEQQKKKKAVFEPDRIYTGTGILDNLPVYFGSVAPTFYEEYVGLALRWHQTRTFPLFQLVWPDPDGHFPWQPGYDERLRQDQPLLFKAPEPE